MTQTLSPWSACAVTLIRLIVPYMNIVLMAGGGGSRLWPLSRQATPKQFLDLGSGQTLIEQAYQRAKSLTEGKNIYLATSENYRPQVEKIFPNMPASRVFYEPEKRDTTAAFATISIRLEKLGQGSEPTVFMWSDHIFTNEKEFLGDLSKIPVLLAQYPDSLIIAGHTPTSPETGLGYLEVGEKISGYDDVFQVKAFHEKPDRATAEQYITAGNYYWNLGYFSARPTYLLSELIRHNPLLKPAIKEFAREQTPAAYQKFPKIAIEYTLIEKTSPILALTGDYGWSDIGSWATIKQIFGKSGDHMPSGHHVHVDSHNNYIYNATDKVVSLVGVKDAIVVVTTDAILVTDTSHSHKVKEVVAKLEKQGKTEYL